MQGTKQRQKHWESESNCYGHGIKYLRWSKVVCFICTHIKWSKDIFLEYSFSTNVFVTVDIGRDLIEKFYIV